MSEALAFTGERFVPGVAGKIWYEHWHRYHFALPLVGGKKVLDVACGAGYGSTLLARAAAEVTGVDISAEAVRHASAEYAALANLRFREGDCAALPFPDASFDVVVSFETIEHIAAQEPFLDEVRRVLRRDGLFVLSSPNKHEYSDVQGSANEFHVRELYREELADMLHARFAHAAWYGQHVSFFSVLAPESGRGTGEMFEIASDRPFAPAPGHSRPLYFVVLTSEEAATVDEARPRLSVLADPDEWVLRDYEKATRELHGAYERGNALEAELLRWQEHHADAVRQRDLLHREHAEAVRQRDALRGDHDEAVRQRDALATSMESLRATLAAREASLAAAEAWSAKLAVDIQALNAEIERRGGWEWWRASFWRLVKRRFTGPANVA